MIDKKFNGNDEVAYHYTYYEYDNFRRLIGYSEINSSSTPSNSVINQNKIAYTYDVNDRVTDINYPDSNDEVKGLKFIYNKDGWLTKIQAKIKKNFLINTIDYREYSYHTDGKVKNIKEYRNFESQDDYILKTYEYDVFDRVTSMKYIDSSNLDKVMESYSYTYDKNNNIKSKKVVNNYPVKDSDKINETKKYTYDALGRLVKTDVTNHSTGKNSSITYGYDKVGNRTSMTKDGVTTNYTYNDLNQLTKSTESKDGKITSNKTYTYDVNGNQIKEKDSVTNITVENTYDVDDRLSTSITTNGEKEVVNQENLYNGNGKRIQKKEGNNVVNYFYQDGVVLYTSDKNGNKTSQNFLGIDRNVIGTTRYSSEGFEYYTYNKDIQGSTTSIVGEDGTSPVAYDYDDFGVTKTIGDSIFFNEVCYTGGIYDVSTGGYYLNARYYNPNNGRFITQDTYRGEVNKPETFNLYAYCYNNPVSYIDPLGNVPANILIHDDLYTAGIVCKNVGLYYTGDFLLNSLSKRPRNKNYSASSNLAKDIKKQKTYKDAKNKIKKKCSGKSKSMTTKGDLNFQRSGLSRKALDMYLAIHLAKYTVTCKKNNGKWSYEMKISDPYNFEPWKYKKGIKNLPYNVVASVNNYAEMALSRGIIKPFKVTVKVKDSF